MDVIVAIQTKITELLGIEHPIIQGGMQWISGAQLAAAVSNAGGLGTIAACSFSEIEDLRTEIRMAKMMTDKPFAVNIPIFPSINPPDYMGYLRIAAEEGVHIIETAGAAPSDYIDFMKRNRMTVMHKCTTIRHALKAESIGCDAVVVDGCECAGHPGESDIGSIVLTPRAVEALRIPVIACGGYATGRGLAAALMLGAEAITMGTRFLVTEESPILQDVKEYIAHQIDETDTMYIMRAYKNTTRVYANDCAREVLSIEQTGARFEKIAPLVSGLRERKMVFETADMQNGGILVMGLSVGLIHDIPSVRVLIDRIMCEAEEALGRFSARHP